MSSFVVALVLCSTFMHAGWNLLARHQRSEAVFFNRMLALTVLIGFVPAILSEVLTHSITIKAWACVVGSGFCCGIYYFYLARAYEFSDFTVVLCNICVVGLLILNIKKQILCQYMTGLWLNNLLLRN